MGLNCETADNEMIERSTKELKLYSQLEMMKPPFHILIGMKPL